jgi:hypothetical protein
MVGITFCSTGYSFVMEKEDVIDVVYNSFLGHLIQTHMVDLDHCSLETYTYMVVSSHYYRIDKR